MRLFGILFATLLLSACEGMPRHPVDEELATKAAGYGSAFGRVVYRENGKEAMNFSFLSSRSLTLFARAVGSREMHLMRVDGDGGFYWPLKAGDYEMLGYQVTGGQGSRGTSTARLMTTFSVPEAGQAVYIGDLEIDVEQAGYAVRVRDQYGDAVKKAEPRLLGAKFDAARRLMRLEAQTGTYKRVIGICSPVWGLSCDNTYQGVQPVLPEGAVDGFPVSQDLTPVLEWKPAGKPELTYDVAIFESVSFAPGVPVHGRGLRGPLIAYAQALGEPRYVVDVPLLAGKLYQWSVRLRDRDAVSSWSTTSHFMFLVVVASRGSGRWFGLATPGKADGAR